MMKNIIIIIETICIIGLVVVCMNFYNRLPGKVVQSGEENDVNSQEVTQAKKATDNIDNTLEGTYGFDANKMKTKTENTIYEDVRYDSIEGITVILEKDGKAMVSVMPDNEIYQSLYSDTKAEVQNEELTGFDGKIASVYFAYFGNGIEPAKILFLMEDGTVEYINSENMIKGKDKKYVSEGKIKDLSNIVRFERVAIGFENENGEREGGSLTTVAIDKDGYGYDLEQLIN